MGSREGDREGDVQPVVIKVVVETAPVAPPTPVAKPAVYNASILSNSVYKARDIFKSKVAVRIHSFEMKRLRYVREDVCLSTPPAHQPGCRSCAAKLRAGGVLRRSHSLLASCFDLHIVHV